MLEAIDLFRLAGDRMRYLNGRQSVIARNIANADTPGYQAQDTAAFSFTSAVLRNAGTGGSALSPAAPIANLGPLAQAMATSASAMQAHATRLRVVAENLANANSTSTVAGGVPYQRKVVSFQEAVDQANGAVVVRTGRIAGDAAPFRRVYDPSHPAADASGYVQMPNVSPDLEMADMREAERSYEANLSMVAQERAMFGKTLDIMKA